MAMALGRKVVVNKDKHFTMNNCNSENYKLDFDLTIYFTAIKIIFKKLWSKQRREDFDQFESKFQGFLLTLFHAVTRQQSVSF